MRSLVILVLSVALATGQLLPDRLAVVDHQHNNFLVRGNLPIYNNRFQMTELKQQLSKLTGLKQFNLQIYSFMNFLTAKQTRNRYIEQNYIQAHPQQAVYINHLLLGSLGSPDSIPSWLEPTALKIYPYISLDNLNALLHGFHRKISTKGEPLIIFFHCSAGIDRTGYAAGAYKMKFFQKSMSEVMKENQVYIEKVRKNMHFNTFNGLKWFCLSLGRSREECLVKN